MITVKRAFILLIGFVFIGSWNGYAEEAKSAEKAENSGIKPSLKQKDEKPKTVIKVNDAEINELDVLGMVNTMVPGAVVHGSVSDDKQMEIRKNAFDRLVTKELMAQEAIKQGLKVSKKEIEKEIKELRKRYKKNKTTLEKALKENKLTMEELRKEIEKNLAIAKIQAEKAKEFKAKAEEVVTEEFMQRYYNENLEKFKIPESTRLRSILIRADPSGGQKAWDEAFARSGELLNQVKAGKDFAELAKEFSQDIYAASGGDMGLGHQGTIMPEIETVAEKLAVGEVAGPIWTIYGFYIIKMEERVPSVQLSFDHVKEELKKERESYAVKTMTKRWLSELKKEAKIEYLNEEDRKLMGAKETKDEKEPTEDDNKNKD